MTQRNRNINLKNNELPVLQNNRRSILEMIPAAMHVKRDAKVTGMCCVDLSESDNYYAEWPHLTLVSKKVCSRLHPTLILSSWKSLVSVFQSTQVCHDSNKNKPRTK